MPTKPFDSAGFWKEVPLSGHLLFYAAVFFTFSVMGFVSDLMGGARSSPRLLMLFVVYSGALAVVMGAGAIRRDPWILAAGVALAFTGPVVLRAWFPRPAPSGFDVRLSVHGIGIASAVAVGYVFFVIFISLEGRRYLRAHGELAIAAEVHRSVVPEQSLQDDGWEWYGRSIPSGDVGGDLIDVVGTRSGRVGYLVDVAGHGVGAGVLTAMAKSAARAHLRTERTAACLLEAWNDTLAGVFEPNRFATCACAVAAPGGSVEFAMAGHLPALVVRAAAGTIEEHAATDPPLGILAGRAFASRTIRMEAGDLLIFVSDGFTEVASRRGEELGLGAVARVVARERERSLPEIFLAVRDAALRHGSQVDDQTILLLRRV